MVFHKLNIYAEYIYEMYPIAFSLYSFTVDISEKLVMQISSIIQ